jgi:hypothetical protein
MSVVVVARRRTYVVLLSRERLTGVDAAEASASRRIERALRRASAACGARLVVFAPVYGRSRDSFFELSFSVIAPIVEQES